MWSHSSNSVAEWKLRNKNFRQELRQKATPDLVCTCRDLREAMADADWEALPLLPVLHRCAGFPLPLGAVRDLGLEGLPVERGPGRAEEARSGPVCRTSHDCCDLTQDVQLLTDVPAECLLWPGEQLASATCNCCGKVVPLRSGVL